MWTTDSEIFIDHIVNYLLKPEGDSLRLIKNTIPAALFIQFG